MQAIGPLTPDHLAPGVLIDDHHAHLAPGHRGRRRSHGRADVDRPWPRMAFSMQVRNVDVLDQRRTNRCRRLLLGFVDALVRDGRTSSCRSRPRSTGRVSIAFRLELAAAWPWSASSFSRRAGTLVLVAGIADVALDRPKSARGRTARCSLAAFHSLLGFSTSLRSRGRRRARNGELISIGRTPEMISGVRASSMRVESTSSTIAKSTLGLHLLLNRVQLHVVAEVVEAELAGRAVDDVAAVRELA